MTEREELIAKLKADALCGTPLLTRREIDLIIFALHADFAYFKLIEGDGQPAPDIPYFLRKQA